MASELKHEVTENILTLTKQFDAPQAVLFQMFSQPERLEQWWGPTKWPMTVQSFDFSPNGQWEYYMQGPDGEKVFGKVIFQEIEEPKLIVWEDMFANDDGSTNDDLPKSINATRFVEENGVTTVTSTSKFDTAADLEAVVQMGVIEGVQDTWKQLEMLVDGIE